MDYLKNVVEYFDELYPCSETQKKFFINLLKNFSRPARILRIACGTAGLEFHLAKYGHDIIGIDTSRALVASAYRRRKYRNSNIRFFHMSTVEMTRYLVKNFFDVISCLNNRIVFIRDTYHIKKFFYDCRHLLSHGGTLILHLQNYGKLTDANDEHVIQHIRRERFSSFIKIKTDLMGSTLTQEIKTAAGKTVKVLSNVRIYPLTAKEIRFYALEAGFTECKFFSNFNKTPYNCDSAELICHIS